MIIVTSNWTDVNKELDRLTRLPSFKGRLALDRVLHKAHTITQEDVHIDTDSLRQSAKTSSSVKAEVYEGVESYGGPSTGIKNPVDYAIYEKARGDEHDWFNRLPTLHESWIGAVKEALLK